MTGKRVMVVGGTGKIGKHLVVIGGGIPQIPGFPFNELVEKVFTHTRKPEPAQSLLIKRAVLGDLAGLIGAARIGFEFND